MMQGLMFNAFDNEKTNSAVLSPYRVSRFPGLRTASWMQKVLGPRPEVEGFGRNGAAPDRNGQRTIPNGPGYCYGGYFPIS